MRWGKARNASGIMAIVAIAMLATVLLSCSAFGLGIGAAPGTINFGDVYRGKRYVGQSYILTTSKNKIVVSLRYAEPHMAWMVHPGARTDYNLSQASEEDISKWISFPQNPVLIDPSYKTYIRLANGETIAANKKIAFYLNIPRNAEPGYHMGSISIDPQMSSELGTGVSTIGISRIVFTFKVPGRVERDFSIISIEARRSSANDVEFDILVKNKGTVTTSFRISEVKVFDSEGNIVTVISSGWSKLRPGETGIIPVYWHPKTNVAGKPFTVKAKISWNYGESSYTQDVRIPEKIEIRKASQSKCSAYPMWFVVATVIAVMVGVYYFDSMPLLASILLVLLSLYKIPSCGRPEIWPIVLMVLAYAYDWVSKK